MNQQTAEKIAAGVEEAVKDFIPKKSLPPTNKPRVESVTVLLEEAADLIMQVAQDRINVAEAELKQEKSRFEYDKDRAERLRQLTRAIQDAIGIGR